MQEYEQSGSAEVIKSDFGIHTSLSLHGRL
jgi:hypothetical protein